jgi:nucleoside-diphosphate-sugar epimerase
MKVFVAGATGALGRPTVAAMVAAGHAIRGSSRGKEKAELLKKLGAEPVEVDLYDEADLRRAISGSDAVLRLSTKIPPFSRMRSHSSWEENNRLRTEGARVLVNAVLAEGIPLYVHESVTFIYADGGERWLDEDAPTDPGSGDILRAALQGEQEAERLTRAGGRGIVLRFAGFYGPDVPSTADMAKMARRRMFAQIGSGTNYFSSIYVPDASRAVLSSLSAPAGVYNVCDDEPIPFRDYVRVVSDAVGAPKPIHLPKFVGKVMFGEVWNYFSRSQRVSNVRLKSATGWAPSMKSVQEGWSRIGRDSRA